MAETAETLAKPRRTLRGRIARALLRCCRWFLFLIVFYFLVAVIGLIPVNNDFEPTADGVEIAITSTAIHADFILPIRNKTMDWSQHFRPSGFMADVGGATRVAFGWGNKEFYVDTPTWGDLTPGTAFRALFWPSASCLHVDLWDEDSLPRKAWRTRVSHEQYRRLADHILSSFRRDDNGRFLLIKRGVYSTSDAFFHAHGSYHAFNTCNCWVGRGLRAAGVRTGWFTPLPKTVSLYLPAIPTN